MLFKKMDSATKLIPIVVRMILMETVQNVNRATIVLKIHVSSKILDATMLMEDVCLVEPHSNITPKKNYAKLMDVLNTFQVDVKNVLQGMILDIILAGCPIA